MCLRVYSRACLLEGADGERGIKRASDGRDEFRFLRVESPGEKERKREREKEIKGG